MKMHLAFAAAAVCLLGCQGPPMRAKAVFEQRSVSDKFRQRVKLAAIAYSGDVPALDACKPVVIGTLTVTAPAGWWTQENVNYAAEEEAARRGGTHVVRVKREEAVRGTVVTTDAVNSVNWLGQTITSASLYARTLTAESAVYVVVFIAPERWDELADELQPTPFPPPPTPPPTPSPTRVIDGQLRTFKYLDEVPPLNCRDRARAPDYCFE